MLLRTELLPNRAYSALALFLLLLAIIPIIGVSNFFIDVVFYIFLYGYLSLCWNLLAGFAGQFSLGHSAYFGIGAYSAGLLYMRFGITPWAAMIVGPLLAASLAWAVGYPTFKLRADYYALATLAFAEVVRLTFLSVEYLGGAFGVWYNIVQFSWVDFQFNSNHLTYYYIALAALCGGIVLTWRIRRSEFGLRLMAIRDSEEGAKSLGVDTLQYKLKVSALSAGLTAIGGVLYAQYTLFLDPNSTMSFLVTADIVLPSLLGGVGTSLGPVLGAFIIQPLSWILRTTIGDSLQVVVRGGLIMVIVLFLPGGLMKTIVDRYIRPTLVKK